MTDPRPAAAREIVAQWMAYFPAPGPGGGVVVPEVSKLVDLIAAALSPAPPPEPPGRPDGEAARAREIAHVWRCRCAARSADQSPLGSVDGDCIRLRAALAPTPPPEGPGELRREP